METRTGLPRKPSVARLGRLLPQRRPGRIHSASPGTFAPTARARRDGLSAGGAKPVQVSTAGALGMISWRQDGKEMYYLTPDWEVMAVEVTTTPTFQAGVPRLLFRLPGPMLGNPPQWNNVSRDGQRFVFAINVPVSVSAR